MSFNVNFLGNIPYNPDNLHTPKNYRRGITESGKPVPQILSRPIGYTFKDMFRLYWTVRSFEIIASAEVFDFRDTLSEFILGGGVNISASAAANLVLQQASSRLEGGTSARGYTKIYSKHTKKIRKANSEMFNDLGPESLDLDENITPNILESHIYGTNEGTLCSAGPVHYFRRNNVFISIDFSDIKYYSLNSRGPRLYWPLVRILITVPSAGAVFGNIITDGSIIFPPGVVAGVGAGFSFVNLNAGGALITNLNQITSSLASRTQLAFVNIDIRPGKRCCDRFLWDGKDNERKIDSETTGNNKDTCESVCGDEDENLREGLTGGVYSKRVDKNLTS
jgi:hypothetical protein